MAVLHGFGALLLASIASSALGETVETLTSATFNERIQSDILLVKFYAPWCGHCKAMAPAYEEAAQRLAKESPPIPLGKVDATVEPQLAQSQGIQGYPTLKIFRRGSASEYGGPRDADGIVKYMKEQVGTGSQAASVAVADTGDAAYLVARLCRDQACNSAEFPILDYDENQNKCVCAAHPCWDDNGKEHACSGDEFPHLTFTYNKEGTLECGCRKEPFYNNVYIAKVKCPGEHCESPDHPIVDYSPKDNKCVCKAHPCHDVDGVRHECSDPKFPILFYREENAGGGVKKICECKASIGKKKAEKEL